MKRWTAFLCTLTLLLFAVPVATAADDAPPRFDLTQLTDWLIGLWIDAAPTPEDAPAARGEDQPRAFYAGVGPYLVPVGSSEDLTAGDPDDDRGGEPLTDPAG